MRGRRGPARVVERAGRLDALVNDAASAPSPGGARPPTWPWWARCRWRIHRPRRSSIAVTLQYARELRDTGIPINAACPGFLATGLNGFRGVRTPEQEATVAIRLSTLPDGGPTGAFFADAGMVPW
ncbi:hypothetical protein ACIBH1_37950 [Nonomuraea sp. NPDC050663]|uniref:hypothetical protein n=1 Tax=Nonomuraea sp. NPDC050663 TaxID=3364370 RepID=UPI0037A4F6ED